jgi:hypothetical protein
VPREACQPPLSARKLLITPLQPQATVPFQFGTAESGDPAGARMAGMKQKTTQLIYGYWNELRRGRLAPTRLEIEPSRIGGILAETFMLEKTATSAFCYRLAGTRLCEIFGSELRGTNLLDGWAASDRALINSHLAATCEQGAVTLLTLEASTGTKHVQLEAILLPLIQPEGVIGRLLGAMSLLSSPNWLGHEKLFDKRLISAETVWPEGRPHALRERARNLPLADTAARTAAMKWRNFRVLEGGRKF